MRTIRSVSILVQTSLIYHGSSELNKSEHTNCTHGTTKRDACTCACTYVVYHGMVTIEY